MVLTWRVGHERSYAVELLLYVVTFGLYGIYWHYAVHKEVYRQFEIDKDGMTEGVLWLLYARVFFPLIWVYQYVFVTNVQHVAQRLGIRQGLSAKGMLGLTIPGALLLSAGLLMLFFALSFGNAAIVEDDMATEAGMESDQSESLGMVALVMAAIGVPLLIAAITLQVTAYARLQADVNRLWRAYDQRMAELSGGPPAAPPFAPGPAPPRPPRPGTTWP